MLQTVRCSFCRKLEIQRFNICRCPLKLYFISDTVVWKQMGSFRGKVKRVPCEIERQRSGGVYGFLMNFPIPPIPTTIEQLNSPFSCEGKCKPYNIRKVNQRQRRRDDTENGKKVIGLYQRNNNICFPSLRDYNMKNLYLNTRQMTIFLFFLNSASAWEFNFRKKNNI